MKADIWNAGISSAIVALALYDNVRLAILLLVLWCPIDMCLVYHSLRGTAAFRQSLIVHHAITFILCVQFFWFDISDKFCRTLLFLEITTPVMCLHNMLQTRVTSILRAVTWILVRGAVSCRLLQFIVDGIARDDDGICQAAPYVIALVTLSIAWTARHNANVSSLQFLLVVMVARVHLSPSRYFRILIQIPVSYIFYNFGYRWLDHSVLLYNLLRLYEGLTITWALAIPAILTLNDKLLSIATNTMCAYQLLKEPTVERVLCGVIMCAYTIHVGPRYLTFGHRIGWHATCTVALIRCMPTT
jgi:hypothetical protein